MRILEFFRSSAVRVALAFVLVTTVATTAVFGLVYFRIGEANEARNRIDRKSTRLNSSHVD